MRLSLVRRLVALFVVIGSGAPAYAQTFTDDPLLAGTPIKAVHLTELRTVVAALRATTALPVFLFSDVTVTAQVTVMRAAHITELRAALNEVFDKAGLARPTYTDPLLAGLTIRTFHIQELRTAILTVMNVVAGCTNAGNSLVNGATHCGSILSAGEVDTWTFTATAGDRIGLQIGEVTDANDFRPWIRLQSPTGASLGSNFGVAAAYMNGVVAPATGTYTVLVASGDSGADGTGTYRLTATHTPGPITVTLGDNGGPLTNGFMHTGTIGVGDLDVWTFTATVGDRIGLQIGEMSDNDDFRPWIRLWAPNGALLSDAFGVEATYTNGAFAPVSGTYLVLVASGDSGVDGSGTYRLTMTKTPGPITVTPGDNGGPLTNGFTHTGEILRGDLDVWTFTATTGDRIGLTVGQITETDDFRPWIRLWAPNGTILSDAFGVNATYTNGAVAPVSGTYLVLVASGDSGVGGTGTYRLTMTATPGPITVAPGDEGGPLTNGFMHTGAIPQGDLDVWTFTAAVGDRIGLQLGQTTDADDFRPWVRLWAPNGTILSDAFGVDATYANGALAPVSGTYLVLVASGDSGVDGSGTYRLTMTRTPGPITVTPGDDGGPLTNGFMHTGTISVGDLDVWTFTATVGDRIGLNLGQITETDDFRPWVRLWAPNGTILSDTFGVDATYTNGAIAPVTGTYLVLVASGDSGVGGIGTYRLTMTATPGPITVTAGDDGGPLTNGFMHTGEILRGDLDVWTFTATAGDRIGLHLGEITDADDFRPWIRLWGPNGSNLGDNFGTDAAYLSGALAPVSGTYLVLVSSGDSGVDGSGTYRLTMTRTPGPITVSGGDEGGPVTVGLGHNGVISQGDLDVWTVVVTAGLRITVNAVQTSETDDFRPWVRLWGPNGSNLGDAFGLDAASINGAIAPATGTYLVLVASGDSGVDGTGGYTLTVTVAP